MTVNPPVPNLTNNKIETFFKCPRKFGEGLKPRSHKSEGETGPLLLYRIFSRALERSERGEAISINEFLMEFQAARQRIGLESDPVEEEILFAVLDNFIMSPYYLKPRSGHDRFLKAVYLANGVNQPLMAVPARVEVEGEEARAVFFKTGKTRNVGGPLDLNHFFAVLGLRSQFPGQTPVVENWFLAHGTHERRWFSNDEEKSLTRELEFFLKEYRRSPFKPRRSRECFHCDFLRECPPWRGGLTMAREMPLTQYRLLPRVSFSMLNSFKSCPFRYKKTYLDRDPVTRMERPEFAIGKAFHAVLERLYGFDKPFRINRDRLHSILDRLWPEFAMARESEQRNGELKTTVVSHLDSYFAHYLAEREVVPAFAVEAWFDFPLESPAGRLFAIEGWIDRIDEVGKGLYEIVDYKTEEKERTPEELAEDLQLRVYFLAAEKFLKLKVERARLIFSRSATGKPHEWVMENRPGETEKLALELGTLYDAMRDEIEFPARGNRYCLSCPFLSDCPEGRKSVGEAPSAGG